MPVEITTSISIVDSDVQTGAVETIHYRVTAIDGEYTAGAYGTISPEGLDYATVPEQDCIDAVETAININQLRGQLTAQIQREKIPEKRHDLPWKSR